MIYNRERGRESGVRTAGGTTCCKHLLPLTQLLLLFDTSKVVFLMYGNGLNVLVHRILQNAYYYF